MQTKHSGLCGYLSKHRGEPILFTQPRLVHQSNSAEDKERIKDQYVQLSHGALCRAFDGCDEAILEVAEEKGVKFFRPCSVAEWENRSIQRPCSS